MRIEKIDSLVVYFDDVEIEVLSTLSAKWKKQAMVAGLKKPYTDDEIEIIDRLDGLFDRPQNTPQVVSHPGNFVEANGGKQGGRKR